MAALLGSIQKASPASLKKVSTEGAADSENIRSETPPAAPAAAAPAAPLSMMDAIKAQKAKVVGSPHVLLHVSHRSTDGRKAAGGSGRQDVCRFAQTSGSYQRFHGWIQYKYADKSAGGAVIILVLHISLRACNYSIVLCTACRV